MADSPLPASTSNLAGSWLESDVLTRSASDPRGCDVAGRFDDAADNHLLVLSEGPDGAQSVEMLGETFRSRAEPVGERLRLAVAQTEPGVALAALILAPAPERRAFIFLAGAYRAYGLRADHRPGAGPADPGVGVRSRRPLHAVFGRGV